MSSSRPPIGKIRILHTSAAAPESQIMSQLEDSQKHFSERIAALKTYQSSQKHRQQHNSRKIEWNDEHHRLLKLRNKLEQECNGNMRDLLMNHVELATSLHRCMSEEEEYTNIRRQHRQLYRQQLKDIDNMIVQHTPHVQQPVTINHKMSSSSFVGNHKIRKSSCTSSSSASSSSTVAMTSNKMTVLTEQDGTTHSSGVIKSVLAEFFLELRHNQSSQWKALKQEENILQHDLLHLHKQFTSILHHEMIDQQDANVQFNILEVLKDSKINLSIFSSSVLKSPRSPRDRHSVDTSFTTGQSVITDELMSLLDEIAMEDMELSRLLQSYLSKLSVLDADFQQLQNEKHEIQQKLCLELGVDVTLANGGWDKDSHDTFVKIYRKAQVSGMLRKKMMDTMVAQLPSTISMDDILLHEEWYRKMKLLQGKHKESELSYTTRRQDLMLTIVEELKGFQQRKADRQRYEQDLLHHEVHRQLLHDRLEELRQERHTREEERKLSELMKQELDEVTLRQKQEEIARQREEQRQRLAKYNEEKRQREEMERQRHEEETQKANELLRKMIEENKSKVELRAVKYSEKQQQRKQREEEVFAEEERKLAMLQKLAEQVPYFETISNIETRYDHSTASTVGHQYIESTEEITRGHIPLNGFADQRIIRDTRFRIVEALRSAGLSQTAAAKEVVQRMNPRPHLAIHGLL